MTYVVFGGIIKLQTTQNQYFAYKSKEDKGIMLNEYEIKKEMWYDGLKNHFSGWEDPNYCVLKFTTERYNLLVDWENAKGNIV